LGGVFERIGIDIDFSAAIMLQSHLKVSAGKLIVSMLIKSGIDEVRLFVGMKR